MVYREIIPVSTVPCVNKIKYRYTAFEMVCRTIIPELIRHVPFELKLLLECLLIQLTSTPWTFSIALGRTVRMGMGGRFYRRPLAVEVSKMAEIG
jgi:hypothetical protein